MDKERPVLAETTLEVPKQRSPIPIVSIIFFIGAAAIAAAGIAGDLYLDRLDKNFDRIQRRISESDVCLRAKNGTLYCDFPAERLNQ